MTKNIYRLTAREIASKTGTPNDRNLTTRYFGRKFLEVLLDRMKALPEGSVVDLTFAEIEIVDASFPDEVFGALIMKRLAGEGSLPCIFLSDLDESNRESVEFTLISRPERHKGLRNCVLPVKSNGLEDLQLVGKCEDNFKQTFDLLRVTRQLTTRQVADVLDLTAQAASSRLKALYDNGVALRQETRDDQGKQFVYKWLL